MLGTDANSAYRTCPNCGVVLEVSLADQFFCEYCGSPLVEVEEQQQEVLPDWLQSGPSDGSWDDHPARQVSLVDSASRAGLGPARMDLEGTGMAQASRPAVESQSATSCALVLGIVMFVASLCMLGWVVLTIAGANVVEPASWLTVSRVVTVSADRGWQKTGIRVREGQVVSIRYLDGRWGIWGGPRAVEQLVDAAGFSGEYRSLGLPLTNAPAGALVGRIGKGAIFHVGTRTRFRSAERGRLELTINDHWLGDNLGAVRVEIEVLTGQ